MADIDKRYIEAILKGDKKGIKAIYTSFLPRITNYIKKNSGTADDAKDVFQEALIVLFKKARQDNFKLTSAFYTYLFGIARNIWGNRLQQAGRRPTTSIPEEKEFADVNEFEEVIQEEERYQLFRSKLRAMGEDCQKLLKLFFKKVPMKEIVGLMGYSSVSYAKKRKFQCKEKLVSLVRKDPKFNTLR